MQKPAAVHNAIRLLYLTLIIGAVRIPLEHVWARLPSDPRVPPAVLWASFIFSTAFTYGLLLWLIYKMDRGRHWARVTFLVLTVIGVPFAIQPMLASFSYSPVSGLLGLLQVGMEVVALVMLFSPQAKPWFRPSPIPPVIPGHTA